MSHHPQRPTAAQPLNDLGRFVRVLSTAAVIIGMAVVGGGVTGCDRQPSEVFVVAPVGMYPTGPYIAERSGALGFWGNGSLQTPVEVDSGRLVITVRARGSVVDGQAPRLVVTVDDREVGVITPDSRVLTDYTLTTSIAEAGITTVKLSFDNYLAKPKPLFPRHVFIESVTFHQPSA